MCVNIYKMAEQELRAYAIECGLIGDIINTLVFRVIHGESWKTIAAKTGYGYDGIKYHRKKIIVKLGLKKL